MTWLQLDDNMPEHPKIVGLSSDAFRLHIRGLAYCARLLTDGRIPEAAAESLSSHANNRNEILEEIVTKKLWRRTKTGFTILQFTEWNPTKAEVKARRQAKKEAGKKGAEKRWGDSNRHGTSYSNRHGTSHSNGNAPLHSTKNDLNQEDLKEEAEHTAAQAIHRLLDTIGEQQGQEAHLELLSMLAQGATAWDFDTVRTATLKKRAKHPWSYARTALRNRLAERQPA